MRTKVARLIKMVLRKVSRRDYLILNPNWVSLGGEGYNLMSNGRANKRYLPVRYSYHTPQDWNLRYDIRGHQFGVLQYSLSAPQQEPFCKVELNVQLPFTWTIKLEDQGLTGNGSHLPCVPRRQLPNKTPWLVGNLKFQSVQNETFYRRTGHRVRLEPGVADADYFNGLVYDSYAEDAVCFPKEILKTVGRFHPLEGKILDIGCAMGLMVAEAHSRGLDAEGLDYSPWAVEQANHRTADRCRVLDLDKAVLSDFNSTYDIITMHSVIEHLGNPKHALELVYGLCRPGSVVYIQTLNADSLMHRIMGEDWGGYTDYTHQSPWITADWIEGTAKELGFEVEYLRRYYVWNDNTYDDVWRSFSSFAEIYPANVILEDQFGDAIEVVLRRPIGS
ncbi:MAG: class I SAM-dependent methyltransferase [bacterium]